jgi:hypothetical protein
VLLCLRTYKGHVSTIRRQNLKVEKFFYITITNIWKRKQENNPIHNGLNKIKYLGTNPTKEMKDYCNENYKTLKKEIEEDTRR